MAPRGATRFGAESRCGSCNRKQNVASTVFSGRLFGSAVFGERLVLRTFEDMEFLALPGLCQRNDAAATFYTTRYLQVFF